MAATAPRHPSSLVLGTVQFGLAYGVSNTSGQVTPAVAQAIVDRAAEVGVEVLDTAAAYGEAEAVVQAVTEHRPELSIITKSPRVKGGDVDAALAIARGSLERFGPTRMSALLAHSAWDLMEPFGDRLWAGLQALKAEGLVSRVGFSAYPDDGVLALARRFGPDLVQIPASVFDQRLVRSGEIEALADSGVEVHVRSLFLQGLAFMEHTNLPDQLKKAGPAVSLWRAALAAGGVNPAGAALDFGLSIKGASRLVVGVTSVSDLDEQVAQVAASPTGLDFSAFAVQDETVLDPWRW